MNVRQPRYMEQPMLSPTAYMDVESPKYPWRKGSRLGAGSFGTVFKAIDSCGMFFAVKEVSIIEQDKQSLHALAQLKQEVELLKKFKHENIIQYLGTDQVADKLYIFLELAECGSLATVYKNFELGDSQISKYARNILRGLKYLHDRNIVHRDIKCSNVLVDKGGTCKLADFGMAKQLSSLDPTKSSMGTAHWMAPEVIVQDKTYGSPADIWSFACSVLEMATRAPPFGDMAWYQAIFTVGRGNAPPIPDNLSDSLRDFLKGCLHIEPKKRLTATELLKHPFIMEGSGVSLNSGPPLVPRSTTNLQLTTEERSADLFNQPRPTATELLEHTFNLQDSGVFTSSALPDLPLSTTNLQPRTENGSSDFSSQQRPTATELSEHPSIFKGSEVSTSSGPPLLPLPTTTLLPTERWSDFSSQQRPTDMERQAFILRGAQTVFPRTTERIMQHVQAFSLAEVNKITNNFEKLVGGGSFGPMYFGKLDNGAEVVVKVISERSGQARNEFYTEVSYLSKIHHRNLVHLIGFCDESNKMYLIHEFMKGGMLREHLYGRGQRNALDWPTRLRIAIDAARGLEYLHHGCDPRIIHRGVKSSNILLDENLRAKMSDFSISKFHEEDTTADFSTFVKGTIGYLDPESFSTNHLTYKCDVYAFGVVLLEIIFGRAPLDNLADRRHRLLVEFARQMLSGSRLEIVADRSLGDNYNKEAMSKVADLAMRCVHPRSVNRPDMQRVLKELLEAAQYEHGIELASPSDMSTFEFGTTDNTQSCT